MDIWIKHLHKYGSWHDDHIILSTNCADNVELAKKKSGLPWPQRCLPFPAASTFAILVLSCRWACLPPQTGGLQDVVNKQASLNLFGALLALGEEGSDEGSWTATLEVSRTWQCSAPRPLNRNISCVLVAIVIRRFTTVGEMWWRCCKMVQKHCKVLRTCRFYVVEPVPLQIH
jgi:hypothetical protein